MSDNRQLDFADTFTSASAPTTGSITSLYNVVIAPGTDASATHNTWAAYLADNPLDGDQILVRASETVDATISIPQNDLDIRVENSTTYTKGTATIGFELTGDRINWNGGRFLSFNVASDVAFEVDAAASFSMLRNMRFNDCDTNIDDNGTMTSIMGVIHETP
jgi:hypothetical protein